MNDLARLVRLVADDLEHRGYAAAGVVRQAAQALVAIPAAPAGCPVCGGDVDQPERGRRRVYCGTPCRRRAENRRRNGEVAA